jgi:hypothetical protein
MSTELFGSLRSGRVGSGLHPTLESDGEVL